MATDRSGFSTADYAAPSLPVGKGRPSLAIAAMLIVVPLLVYIRVCWFGYIGGDDAINIFNNPHLNPATWKNLQFFWLHSYYLLYTPITYSVYWAVAAIEHLLRQGGGRSVGPYPLSPQLFHTANLCFQLLNVFLAYALLRCFVKRDWAAAAGALLFGIHPVQVEPVAWITGLNNLAAGTFALVALRQYTLFARADAQAGSQAAVRRHYLWATVAFALALLCKPTAVMVPALAWVLDRWMVGRSARACTRSLASWVTMALLCVLVTEAAQSTPVVSHAAWPMRPLVAGDALDFYLFKLFVPLRLYPDYGRTPEWLLSQGWRYVTVIPPLVLGIAIWSRGRRYPCLLSAASLFVLAVLPTLGLMPTYVQFASTVCDRYLYLAMLGPALLLACSLERRRPWLDFTTAIVLLVLGSLCWRQVGLWRDTGAIYSYNLAANPRSWISYVRLGILLDQAGNTDRAIADYEEALRLQPNQVAVLDNLGSIYAQRNQLDRAQAYFTAAVAADPTYEQSVAHLGMVLIARGRVSNAIEVYTAFLRDRPDSETVEYCLAQALMRRDDWTQAAQRLELMLSLDPFNGVAHIDLATLLDKFGRAEDAGSQYAQAVALLPGSAKANSAYGMFLLRHGRAAEALPLLNEAARIQPRDAPSRYNLGLALAKLRRLSDAAQQFSAAIALEPRYVVAYYGLGTEQIELGDARDAIAAWRHALAIDPSFAPARRALDFAGRAAPAIKK